MADHPKQAVARLDTDAYAFVNNDNPADRAAFAGSAEPECPIAWQIL